MAPTSLKRYGSPSMDQSIKSHLKSKNFRSVDAFSKELVKSYAEFKDIRPRILSMRIAELDKGEGTWWDRREPKLNRLLEVLEIDPDEFQSRRIDGRHTFRFKAFPLVPPFDFRRKETWEIGEPAQALPGTYSSRYDNKPTLSYWFESTGFAPGKIQWLHVEDDVEYQLLTHRLKAIGPRDLLATPTLGEALDQHLDRLLDPAPLILVFESASYNDVLHFASMYRASSPRLIVSPLPAPSPEGEQRGSAFDRAHVPAAAEHTEPLPIEPWFWLLKPDWRSLMMQWLERHFTEQNVKTGFTYELARTLLDEFDRDAQWFATVHDVLVLCRTIDYEKVELREALTSKGGAPQLLKLLLGSNKPQLTLLRQLIAARWRRWDLPWLGGIDEKEWRTLGNNPHDAGTLEQKKIIVRAGDGYDFANPIVARILLREYLDHVLRKGDIESWTPACFDAQRRVLLDAALDAVKPDALDRLAERLAEDADAIETRGAIEALFVAIGRRLIRAEPVHESQLVLASLTLRQVHGERGLALPLSRALATQDVQLEWIAVCWAWSLAAPPVVGWEDSWFFPGWRADLPDSMDERLAMAEHFGTGSSGERWSNLATPLHAFLTVVTRWMEHQTKPPQYERNMPAVFDVALLAHAAAGKWAADAGWWYRILGVPVAEATLCKLVDPKGTAAEKKMARAWWPSIIRHLELRSQSSMRFNRFAGESSRSKHPAPERSALLGRVMASLEDDADAELTRLSDDDIRFLRAQPDLLTLPFQRALIRLVLYDRRFELASWEVPGFLLRFSPEIAADLETLLDHDKLGPHAARLLWEWRPLAATHLLSADDSLSRSGMQNLLLTSPPESTAVAIARLQREPEIFADQTRRHWALARLPDARQHAPALLKML